MKQLFFILLSLPIISFSQQHTTKTDSSLNIFGDSVSARVLGDKYSAAHQLMVSFTQGCTADVNDFWIYLLSELHYKMEKPDTAQFKRTKEGLQITFSKYGNGVQEFTTQSITVHLICNQNGDYLKSAWIAGNDDLLTEIFTKYFGGSAKADLQLKNGLNVVRTVTDEIRLLPGKLVILPLHGSLVSE